MHHTLYIVKSLICFCWIKLLRFQLVHIHERLLCHFHSVHWSSFRRCPPSFPSRRWILTASVWNICSSSFQSSLELIFKWLIRFWSQVGLICRLILLLRSGQLPLLHGSGSVGEWYRGRGHGSVAMATRLRYLPWLFTACSSRLVCYRWPRLFKLFAANICHVEWLGWAFFSRSVSTSCPPHGKRGRRSEGYLGIFIHGHFCTR